MSQEPVSNSTFLVFLKPDQLVYRENQTGEEVLTELEARIRSIQVKKYSSDRHASPLRPIERVLYGLKLGATPGYGLLKMVQLLPTSVYKNYLYADISDHARLYVEIVEGDMQPQTGSEEEKTAGEKGALLAEEELEEEVFTSEGEAVGKKVFIFMVCDRDVKNYRDMLRLI